MSITEPLVGKFVNLRCVDISDAKFTLEIRNNPELTDFIPKVVGNIETQEQWISKQRLKKGDYFFIIEDKKGFSLGTIGCYDFDDEDLSCETGRYISIGDAIYNIEAVVLLYDFVFYNQNLNYINVSVDENNGKVINLNKKFGAEFFEKMDMGNWSALKGIVTKKKYLEKRREIIRLLDAIS